MIKHTSSGSPKRSCHSGHWCNSRTVWMQSDYPANQREEVNQRDEVTYKQKKKKSSGVSPRGHRITTSSEAWYLPLWWPDWISCIFSSLMGFLLVVTMWGWSLWCAVKQQCGRDPIQKKVWTFHPSFCFVVTLQWHRDDLWSLLMKCFSIGFGIIFFLYL